MAETQIIFLGTGTPNIFSNRMGPSIAIKYEEEILLFDAGIGLVRRAKEAKLVDAPGWGAVEDRGPMWEVATAICLLQAGVDIIRMRHPRAAATVRNFINQIWK